MLRARRLLAILWDGSADRPQNKWMVNLAAALVMSPAILLFPITLNFFVHPLWMFGSWDLFGLFAAFYGVPWIVAGFLIYAATTIGRDVGKVQGSGVESQIDAISAKRPRLPPRPFA